ncbi:MAG: response regulator transcription factor [bacterium]
MKGLPDSKPLSPRQREIASLIAQGLPTKTIGATLHISPWTVATHLRRLYLRFDVSTRAAMIARLLDEGLLTIHRP